eukprot:GFKZ01015326.1.p1 GENE.GFKZ01015326.1~~GFKZ01015326.1.p1  ORF type:complete len:368 (-),score=34.43 GFKZ01015326.1:647-1750(-)
MSPEHLLLLTSQNSLDREKGLRIIFDQFDTCKDTASANGRGLSALFAAIFQHDPSFDIRNMVLRHPLISLETLCEALQDTNSKLRKTAAETIYKRTSSLDQAAIFAPKFLSLLTLETHDSTKASILQILRLMYAKPQNSPHREVTLTALGHSEIGSSIEDIFEVPLFHSVIQDLAESDSLQARCALCPLLAAIITSASAPREDSSQDTLHILQISFRILDALLQDLHRPVQMAAVDALHQAQLSSEHFDFKGIARLSEQSVKCVLRMTKLPLDKQIDDDTRCVLELLTLYPFATLRGYSLAEKFLRDQWYRARMSFARSDHDRLSVADFIGSSLVGIMKLNVGFAQVLDLKRGRSEKSGWIMAHQDL